MRTFAEAKEGQSRRTVERRAMQGVRGYATSAAAARATRTTPDKGKGAGKQTERAVFGAEEIEPGAFVEVRR